MITTLEGDEDYTTNPSPLHVTKQKNQLMTDLTTQIKARKNPKSIPVVVTHSLLNLIANMRQELMAFKTV